MAKRIPYVQFQVGLRPTDTLILKGKGKGKERKLEPKKWWINKNTPPGDDAELWERKPYGGQRFIERKEIIAIERED